MTEPIATRRTVLGDLPIDVNAIDMLDNALTNVVSEARKLRLERDAAYAELRDLRRLRKALKRGALDGLVSRLHELACLIDPDLMERYW